MTNLKLKIRCSTGEDYSIEIDDSKTVLDLKNEIEKQFNVPSSSQRLIYRGRILQDDKTCNEYGIQTEQTVHMVKAKSATSNPPSSAPSNPTPSITTPAGPPQASTTPSSNPSTAAPTQPPTMPPFGFGANPFGLPMPPPGTDPFSPANLQAQAQQMMQNPEMIRNIMQNPMVQSMLSNPEFIRSMMNQNPQMREILERNPEVAQVMNNPEMLRETFELMSNPASLQEILRSQDQAIANLTSMEGGFDALRRMYSQVQEPMMEAADSMNRTATPTSLPSQPPSTLYSDAVPNPWGNNNTAATGTGTTPATAATASGTPGAVPGTSTTLPSAATPSPYFANMMNMFGSGYNPANPAATTATATTGTTAAAGSTTTTPTTTPTSPAPPPAAPAAPSTTTGTPATAQPPPPLPPFGFGAGGAAGGIPNINDPAMLQSLLSNPATQAMMQSMMNDPNMVEMMINMNPMIRNNPMLCNMLRDPQMRSTLFNPQTLQAAMQMQQMFGGMNPMAAAGATGATTPAAGGGAAAPGINPYFNPMFMQQPPPAGAASTLPPREQYASQLEELKSMGFFDEEENLRILQICHGNINLAVDRLLQN